MKKLILRSALVVAMPVLAVVFSVAPSAIAQQPPTCTGGAALSGWYGMLVGSYSGTGGKYLVGAVHFDGECGITGTNTFGGTGGNFAQASVTGSYGLNADGTFGITLNLSGQSTPQTYIVGVSQSGNEAIGIETDGTSAFIDLQSQFTTLTGGFTNASLTGTYAAACIGAGTDLNYQTFDGLGNITGVDSEYNVGVVTTNTPYTGTYTVNPDGTYQGSVLFNGSTVPFYGVLDNGNNEIEYIYTGVNSCSGKKSTGATLSGSYGILVGGPATTGGGEQFLSGVLDFNGGALTGEVNGGLNSVYTNSKVTGSYAVNSNNTVTITMELAGQSSPQTYNVGVSEAGNEADGIETDASAAATMDIQSQVLANGQTYSNSSLNGTYAVLCSSTSLLGLNYVTFDGLGDISVVVLAYSNGGGYEGVNETTGSYKVHSDGSFSGSLTGGFAQYSFTGVIDNDTSEIAYTYEVSGAGNQACSGVSTYGPIGTAQVVSTPTFNPAPGAYGSAQSVTLSDATANAVIHYTTNGTPPTPNSPVYNNMPIPVSATTSIHAIAMLPGDNNSAIGSGTYFITILPTAATPTFSPLPGTYTSAQTVILSDTTPGAVIHCTTNGTMPTSTSPVCTTVSVTSTTTIEAIAVATGYNNSAVATGTYTIAPAGTQVNLFSYYNIFGIATVGNPPKFGGLDWFGDAYNSGTLGTTVTYQGQTFTLGPANALDAVVAQTVALPAGSYSQLFLLGLGVFGAQNNQSIVVTYTDGSTSTFTQSMSDWWHFSGFSGETIVSSPPNIISYNGSLYSQPVSLYGYTFNLTASKVAATVRLPFNRNAIFLAIGLGGSGTLPTAATPTLSPAPGTYSTPQTVMLSDTTPGAVIHCTTNGTAPTPTSPVCTTLTVSGTTTIEAIAVANGYNNSAVATGVYTFNSQVVNLSSYYNVYGIATVGTSPKNGGFDNDGYAYNSSLLGTSLTYQGLNFTLGAANTLDAVTGQTITVNPGQYGQLYLLGAAVNGAQLNQTVVVTYSDGSSSTFTQSLSDWAIPQSYPGESLVARTATRVSPNGQTQAGTYCVYGYAFALNSAKAVTSVKLPFNRNVVFLNMGLGNTATQPTPVVPYIQVNNQSWQQTSSVTVFPYGQSVNLGPQPLAGTWSWTGPNGYTSTSRQINNIPLSFGANVFVATYTNSSGIQTAETFTITVGF
jgi:hypothetical protein